MDMNTDECNGAERSSHRLARIIVPILVVLIILLLVLIIYLCYLNPVKYGGFPVGPTSPYSQVQQQ